MTLTETTCPDCLAEMTAEKPAKGVIVFRCTKCVAPDAIVKIEGFTRGNDNRPATIFVIKETP